MTRIETTAIVGEDRTLTLQLPKSVVPGEHAVVVLLDGTDQVEQGPSPSPAGHRLARKGKLLVFTGKLEADFDPATAVREIYEERERRFLDGPFE